MRPLVSVIVPTRDRPGPLGACLDALSEQTAADRLEVIVVDDASMAPGEVAAVVGRHASARLVTSSGKGPAAARNLGAKNARGVILCFTDDDCVVGPEWVERLAEVIERGADVAAGTSSSSGGPLADASEIVAHAPARARPRGSDPTFAPSNNLACSKAVWEVVNFDESYPDAAAEDRDWCARVHAAGYAFRLAPEARLVHHQELTLRRFLARQVRYGFGAYRFRRRDDRHARLEHPGFYVSLLREAFARGLAIGLLVAAAQIATAYGFARAALAQRRRPQP